MAQSEFIGRPYWHSDISHFISVIIHTKVNLYSSDSLVYSVAQWHLPYTYAEKEQLNQNKKGRDKEHTNSLTRASGVDSPRTSPR